MNKNIECKVLAFGAWGDGFENWSELRAILNSEVLPDIEANKGPKPSIIPANERRRAPLPVRLAVESSWQATQQSGYDPKELSCVFVSGFGDTQLTDYMCKALASETKALSPTKFHNSVHNAAAGYWTISTGCEKAANSVAGFQESVSLTLLEALIQCQQEHEPILLTFFDAPVSEVLTDIMGKGSAFAFSMIITPNADCFKSNVDTSKILKIRVEEEEVEWPVLLSNNDGVLNTYEKNPSGRILSLAELFLGLGTKHRRLPLNNGLSLHLELE